MSILYRFRIFVLFLMCLAAFAPLFTVEIQASPTTWIIETVDASNAVGTHSSIAIDSDGFPHISYYDLYWDNLKYARWTGIDWIIMPVDTPGDVGWYTSLALDSSDNPHISYYDITNEDLKYARWTGTAWSIETVDSTGYVGIYSSLALDSNDLPHISYYGNTDLKYAATSDEYFTSVYVIPFDSDSDGNNDAVEIQVNVDTSHSGIIPINIFAFLVDSLGYNADLNSTSWNITGQAVELKYIYLYVPPGYFDGPSMYMVMLNLFDDDGFLEDSHYETDIYLYPASALPTGVTIESCGAMGDQKNFFELSETVYVRGEGYSLSTTYDFYVVADEEVWNDGMMIPERVPETATTISSSGEGNIPPAAVWNNPQTIGNYDIVVDVNGNGQYDSGTDALDDNDIEVTAGLSIIPELSSILPLFVIATLTVIIYRKRIT